MYLLTIEYYRAITLNTIKNWVSLYQIGIDKDNRYDNWNNIV